MIQRETGLLRHVAAALLATGTLAAGTPAAAEDTPTDPNAWPMHGHGYDNTRFSLLKRISGWRG